MSTPVWEQVAAAAALIAVAGTAWAMLARDGLRRSANELRSGLRARRAERTALEATLEDEAFDPERIRATVAEILDTAQSYWRHGGDEGSPGRPDGAAISGWVRAHGLAGAIHLDGRPRTDLLSVVNREGESDDRVEVRVRARLELDARQHWVDPHTIHIDDRWTLGRRADRWVLLDGRADRFARPVLTRPLIPAAWADDDRLREQALTDLAGDAVGTSPADLTASTTNARQRLLDLAVIDNRFSPALLDATIRHLLEAWEQETLAPTGRLADLCAADARHALLVPTDQDPDGRFTIRDVELTGWEPTVLDAEQVPPSVTVRVAFTATRFVCDARNAIIAGSATTRHPIELDWTLGLVDRPRALWRLAASRDVSGMP